MESVETVETVGTVETVETIETVGGLARFKSYQQRALIFVQSSVTKEEIIEMKEKVSEWEFFI